jgi:hypothetical protein
MYIIDTLLAKLIHEENNTFYETKHSSIMVKIITNKAH